MRRRVDINEIVKWIIIAICAAMFYLATSGCNPVKQVLKSPEKTEEVVVEYVKRNPQKNDTVYKYLPGDTIETYQVIYDSVKLPYPVNHKYTEVRTIERTIVDTVKIEVIDRKFIDALDKRVKALEGELAEWKDKAKTRGWWLVVLITIIVGSGVFYLVKTFQPKITIGK
jgi:hypothetical protein